MHTIFKKATVFLVVLAIAFGTFGAPNLNVARASENGGSAQMSEEQLIKLLTQLISMLQEQLRILQEQSGDDDSTRGLTEAEAEIFTNETLVKIELNGKKTIFSTTATSRDDIIDEIVSRYDLSEATVSSVLTVEEEDRASRDSDRDWADDDDDDEDEDDDDDEDEDDEDEDD
jgi:hypothetical protein